MRIAALVLVAGIVLVPVSRASSDAAPMLSGKMTQLKYLVGTWSCTTKVAAMGKTPAQIISAKSIYWVEPGNVIGDYYSSKPFSSSGFIGWSNSKKLWWSNGADEYGSVDFETGKDSDTSVQVLTGTNWYQGVASQSRDTITKTSDSNYSDTFQLVQSGKVTFNGTSVCTKKSNKTM